MYFEILLVKIQGVLLLKMDLWRTLETSVTLCNDDSYSTCLLWSIIEGSSFSRLIFEGQRNHHLKMDLLSVEDIESLCKVPCVYLIFIEVIFNNFCKANICLF